MTGSGRRSARSRIKSSTDDDDDGGDDSIRRTRQPNLKSLRDRSKRRHSSIGIFNIDLKIMLGVSVFALLIIFFLIQHLVKPAKELQRPRVVTPFPGPKLMDLPQFQGEHKESLYWGTYRPHVYLGIRARTPRSLVSGLMWIGVKDGRYHMRHVCQDSDELSTYGWTQHNGRDFGHQVLVDQDLKLGTSFLKSKSEDSGYGGDWAVRIDVQSENSEQNEEIQRNGHLFFYLANEDGGTLSLGGSTLDISENSLLASGTLADVGGWQLHLVSKDSLEVHYSGFRTPHIHNLSELVQQNLAAQIRKFGQLQLSDSTEDFPNILVFQISARIPFKTDIVFVSGTRGDKARVEERVSSLTGTALTHQLQDRQMKFDAKFEQCFKVADKLEPESTIVGKAVIANMLGGIGYFYGQSKISYPRDFSNKDRDNFIAYWPAELYTAVPSRPFFPRGFLWDEGFHQLLIWRWDIHICLDILGHWLDLMNIDGWIPREQILGSEALSKVPEEFVLQHPTNGNPPTLFLVVHDLLHGIEKNKFAPAERNEITSFFEHAFVRLEAWFQWFNTTQSGKIMGSYFWHGRDNTTTHELNPKTLSSGLDDYPRASHPNEDERHLDLRCWMLLAANCMDFITKLLKEEKKLKKDYAATAKLLSDFEILNQVCCCPLQLCMKFLSCLLPL
uniref:Mannosyl-oligosaccharide glucosidase n=1 Tax=Rhizophora mucronata TaxID=61149 RepID=A0A2P2M3T4_RHIMU